MSFEKPQSPYPENQSERRNADIESELFFRAVPGEYLELIENADFVVSQAPYAEMLCYDLRQEPEKYDQYLAAKFKDAVVLDLACGVQADIDSFARDKESKTYIGVDLNPVSGAVCGFEEATKPLGLDLPDDKDIVTATQSDFTSEVALPTKTTPPEIVFLNDVGDYRSVRVRSDLLNCISRLRDSSVNVVTISGLESGADEKTNQKYLAALQQEIKRVLVASGICISYNSDIGYMTDQTGLAIRTDDVGKTFGRPITILEKSASKKEGIEVSD